MYIYIYTCIHIVFACVCLGNQSIAPGSGGQEWQKLAPTVGEPRKCLSAEGLIQLDPTRFGWMALEFCWVLLEQV